MDDRKSSTMSSIFIGSTLEKPNVELIINAVATILHSQMLEVRMNENLQISNDYSSGDTNQNCRT